MGTTREGQKPEKPRVVVDLPSAGTAHPGITPALWAAWVEAAAVTLERFHPASAKACTLTSGSTKHEGMLQWVPATAQMNKSHANPIDATEHGAYAVASAALGVLEGWRVEGRAHHATGADLIMLAADQEDEEAYVRLEVSGMAEGSGTSGTGKLKTRLRKKLAQLRAGDEDEPGVAAVFGFELALLLAASIQR